ncbi:MAG: DUF47 family protein [Thermofilaceae archaeon]
MSSVSEWFGLRRRERALRLLEQHMDEVLRCVKELRKLLEAWMKEKDNFEAGYNSVKSFEKAADVIRRQTARLLAGGGEMDAVERTFLLRLMGRLDRIADWSLEAARILLILGRFDIPIDVRKLYMSMGLRLESITEKTFEAVRLLHTTPLKALDTADEVEKLEEEIDAIYAEDREYLSTSTPSLPASIVVLLYEALNALENAADSCEDSCDIVREVVVRLSW